MFLTYVTAGPTVESTMKVSILSSRDTVSNVVFTLSFNVSFGPPSRLFCNYNNNMVTILHNVRGDHPKLLREVIRSQYVDSSKPDMTRVTLKVEQPREDRTYVCEVTVEGRTNINGNTNYAHAIKGTGTSTVMVTGK